MRRLLGCLVLLLMPALAGAQTSRCEKKDDCSAQCECGIAARYHCDMRKYPVKGGCWTPRMRNEYRDCVCFICAIPNCYPWHEPE